MSYTAEQLLRMAVNYEQLAQNAFKKQAVFVASAEDDEKKRPPKPGPHRYCGHCGRQKKSRWDEDAQDWESYCPSCSKDEYLADDSKVAIDQLDNILLALAKKKEKKLDPKAKVRNRGTVCVPAEKAKDKKDHFPINDADQARNALARVHQYSSKPEWWSGSLKGLQDLVARKVKAKYPKIDVGGKKKEKKSSLEVELFSLGKEIAVKYGQASTWDPTEQSEEDAARFMAGGPGVPPPASPKAQPHQTGGAIPRLSTTDTQLLMKAQDALNRLGYKGQDSRPLDVDGKLGPNTRAAISAYVAKNSQRIPQGFTEPGPALYTMIARDASGENKTTTFDHRAANESLNAASAFMTQLQAWQAQRQITPQNVGQLNQMLGQYAQNIAPVLKSIGDTLQDERSTQQEKQLANQLNQKAGQINKDMKAWMDLFNQISATATRK